MGNTGSGDIPVGAREAAKKFTASELQVLRVLFKDIASRSPGPCIDKDAFLKLFPLPGLLGERLFQLFDTKHTGVVDFEEFLVGIAVCVRGTTDERISFLFHLYDLNGEGTVLKSEMRSLLCHLPPTVLSTLDTKGLPLQDESGSVSLATIDSIVNDIYAKYDTDAKGALRFPNFKRFLEDTPIMDLFLSSVFPLEPKPTAPMSPTMKPRQLTSPAVAASRPAPPVRAASSPVIGHSSPIPAGGDPSRALLSSQDDNAAAGIIHAYRRGSSDHNEFGYGSTVALGHHKLYGLYCRKCKFAVPRCGACGGMYTERTKAVFDDQTHTWTVECEFCGPEGMFRKERRESSESDGGIPPAGGSEPTPGRVSPLALPKGSPDAGPGDAPHLQSPTKPSFIERLSSKVERNRLSGDGKAPKDAAIPVAGGMDGTDEDSSSDEGEGGEEVSDDVVKTAIAITEGPVTGVALSLPSQAVPGNHGVVVGESPPALPLAVPPPPIPVVVATRKSTTGSQGSLVADASASRSKDSGSVSGDRGASATGLVVASARSGSFKMPASSVLKLDCCLRCGHAFGDNDWVAVKLGQGHRYFAASSFAVTPAGPEDGTAPDNSIPEYELDELEEGSGSEDEDTPVSAGFRTRAGSSQAVPSWSHGAGASRSMQSAGVKPIHLEGYMFKVGRKMKRMIKRYFRLNQNLLYWYNTDDPEAPLLGVLFVEGSYISPSLEDAFTSKGYYGINIHTSIAHGEQSRMFFTKSVEERDAWLDALSRASRVVPFEKVYTLGKEIGSGRFSKVYEATNKATGAVVAVKLITKADLKENERELLRTEIAVLKLVKHPHIVRLEDVFETPQTIYIVMERVKGGELFHRIVGRPRFTEPEARALVIPLLQAVAYIHGMGIIHRDIKPENILCGNSLTDIKLADFGLSKLVTPQEIMKMACGTLSYVAPEVLTMKGYGKEADLWSVGVILYLIVRGRLPFEAATREEVLARTAAGRPDFSHAVWQKWSPVGRSFVAGLLAKDPRKRLTAEQALKHPWMSMEMPAVSLPFLP